MADTFNVVINHKIWIEYLAIRCSILYMLQESKAVGRRGDSEESEWALAYVDVRSVYQRHITATASKMVIKLHDMK